MSKIDDGGTAFPHLGPTGGEYGMPLRTWLAGKAMEAMLSGLSPTKEHMPKIARRAWDMADAMLAARKAVRP